MNESLQTEANNRQTILPIMAYGNEILRRSCRDVKPDLNGIEKLIAEMWECLNTAGGVGLAAPQVNSSLKLFIVNSKLMYEGLEEHEQKKLFEGDEGIAQTFINGNITSWSDDMISDYEACLSIPGITEIVERHRQITIDFLDPYFQRQTRTYSGYTARVIQHEYEHTQGILFIDHLPAIKKKLLKKPLKKIVAGEVSTKYPVRFLNK
jgi:peptide deformylase